MDQIRVKAFRKLIEIVIAYKKGEIANPEDIVDKFSLSYRTAYDYWNTLKFLERILSN